MNRRSFFAFFTAFLAVPSLLKRRDETSTVSASAIPGPSQDLGPTVPSGMVMAYIGTEPPPGWVFCDGASYSHGVRDPGHSHSFPHVNYIRKV